MTTPRPRNILTYLILLSAIMAVGCEKKPLDVRELEGIWVREQYVEAVRATKRAFSGLPESIAFTPDGRITWTNFHEGSWVKIVGVRATDTADVYRLSVGRWEEEFPKDTEIDAMILKVRRDASGKISGLVVLESPITESKDEPLIRIPVPLDLYVNGLLLAGTYTDEKGAEYSFDKSCHARWPGMEFTYEMLLDAVEIDERDTNYIITTHGGHRKNLNWYGFKWREGKLELFRRKSHDGPIACEAKPFAVLTPTKPPRP